MAIESNSRPTQCARLVEYMRKHVGITQIDALNNLGILRLASRISELKEMGYLISDEYVVVTNRWNESCRIKKYRLVGEVLDDKGFSNV